jgi:TRAP-type C4-dicarboxylate transport system permease small subunit
MYDTYKTSLRWANRALEVVTVGAFLLTIAVATLQVISRYLPDSVPYGFLWTGELSTYLLVFVVFFGSVLAEIKGGQLRIDIVRDQFVARIGSVYELFVLLSSLAFTLIVVYGAFLQAQATWDRYGLLLTWFRIGYLYVFVMVAFSLLSALRLRRSVNILRAFRRGKTVVPDDEREGW